MLVTRVRRRALLVLGMVVVSAVVVGPGLWARFGQGPHRGQAMTIPDDARTSLNRAWSNSPRRAPVTDGPPFLTSVSRDGRYFLDQYGKPMLVKGDSPWALMTRLLPAEAEKYFADRQSRGFNVAIISLLGAQANGGPSDDGRTIDGLRPFTDGDILRWEEPYWRRMADYLRTAADHGVTVMLYPIDGWTIGRSFVPKSTSQCREYGVKVATRFVDLPNIAWMAGGDYFPGADTARGSDVDRCIDAMMHGIRQTGDARPFSIQLWYDKSVSTASPFWATRVDWNFVYTYFPTYQAVLEAYQRTPRLPALLGEANYERENNQPETPATTDETLRRQVLWALTSGSAGDVMGSDDWEFHDGWQERLSTPAVEQISRLRELFAQLPWWQLIPDTRDELVTSGRGARLDTDEPLDVLDNDYATAARAPDGRVAVVYVPTARTITLDLGSLPDDTRAVWIDPSSGARHRAPTTVRMTTPGVNDSGAQDWLLLLRS